MSPGDYAELALQLVAPISMLVGLWVTGRWLPAVKSWLSEIGAGSISSSRAGQLVLWLALGLLFANPVLDLLRALVTVARLAVGPLANVGTMSTIWGQIPFWLYSEIDVLMTLVVYLLVLWAGARVWPRPAEESGARSFLLLEEWFVLFASASLVNHFIENVVLSIIWLPVPNAAELERLFPVGFFGAWLLALAIVAVIFLVLLNSIRKSQPTG